MTPTQSIVTTIMSGEDSPIRRRRSPPRLIDRARSNGELSGQLQGALVTTVLIIFLLLHVLAGAVMQRAGAGDGPPSTQDLSPQPYD